MRRDAGAPALAPSLAPRGSSYPPPTPSQPCREEEDTCCSWKEASLLSPLETCKPFSEAGPLLGTCTRPCVWGREYGSASPSPPQVETASPWIPPHGEPGERADVLLQSLCGGVLRSQEGHVSEYGFHECPFLGLWLFAAPTRCGPAPRPHSRSEGGEVWRGEGWRRCTRRPRAVLSEPGLWSVHPCVRRGCGGFLPRLPDSPVCASGCAGASSSFHVNTYMQMQTSVHIGRGALRAYTSGCASGFEANVWGHACVCAWCF